MFVFYAALGVLHGLFISLIGPAGQDVRWATTFGSAQRLGHRGQRSAILVLPGCSGSVKPSFLAVRTQRHEPVPKTYFIDDRLNKLWPLLRQSPRTYALAVHYAAANLSARVMSRFNRKSVHALIYLDGSWSAERPQSSSSHRRRPWQSERRVN